MLLGRQQRLPGLGGGGARLQQEAQELDLVEPDGRRQRGVGTRGLVVGQEGDDEPGGVDPVDAATQQLIGAQEQAGMAAAGRVRLDHVGPGRHGQLARLGLAAQDLGQGAGGEVVVPAQGGVAAGNGRRRQPSHRAGRGRAQERQQAQLDRVVVDGDAVHVGHALHPLEVGRPRPLVPAATGPSHERVATRRRHRAVALTGHRGQPGPDLPVRAPQDEVADLHVVVGPAGDDLETIYTWH